MNQYQETVKKGRILLFTDTLCDPNGVSRFIQDMTKEAKENGADFYVITSTKKEYCDKLKNMINIKPIIRFPIPFYSDLDFVIPPFLRLYSITKELNPDVIHISTPGFIGVGAKIISKKLNIPTNGTYHTNFPAYVRDNTKSKTLEKITILFMRWFYKDFKRVISRSSEYLSILKDDIKIDERKLNVLKIGIDNKKFHKKYKDLTIWNHYDEIRNSAVKLLYVGRFTKEKNFPFLLDLFERLKNRYPVFDVQLVIIGEGTYLSKKSEYLKKDIVFMGYRGGEELSTLYASSDIFLFPSNTDTLGQVVLEAMSSALPVVVSDMGGPKDILDITKESKEGYSIPTSDIDSWIDTLAMLIRDKKLRAELGERGFIKAQKSGINDVFNHFIEINLSSIL